MDDDDVGGQIQGFSGEKSGNVPNVINADTGIRPDMQNIGSLLTGKFAAVFGQKNKGMHRIVF